MEFGSRHSIWFGSEPNIPARTEGDSLPGAPSRDVFCNTVRLEAAKLSSRLPTLSQCNMLDPTRSLTPLAAQCSPTVCSSNRLCSRSMCFLQPWKHPNNTFSKCLNPGQLKLTNNVVLRRNTEHRSQRTMAKWLWAVFISVFSYLQMAELANGNVSGHLLANCHLLKRLQRWPYPARVGVNKNPWYGWINAPSPCHDVPSRHCASAEITSHEERVFNYFQLTQLMHFPVKRRTSSYSVKPQCTDVISLMFTEDKQTRLHLIINV